MQPLLTRLTQGFSQHFGNTPRTLVLAYSGGLDSSVLLHLLNQFKQQQPAHHIRAVHIHHGISRHADDWSQHCAAQCQQYHIPLHTVSVTLPVPARKGLEADARTLRYQALKAACPDDAILITAHHQDDQLETLLLQLKRGAGPKGLSGMAELSELTRGICLWRPLLQTNRADLEHYATQQGLSWIDDDSNQDTRLDRNFLRQQILPQMTQRWPGLPEAAARSAALCAEQQALLDEISQQQLTSLQDGDGRLHINVLLGYSLAWQRQLVRQWLADHSLDMPSRALLDEILAMTGARPDARPEVVIGDHWVRRFQSQLYLGKTRPATLPGVYEHWTGQRVAIDGERSLRGCDDADSDGVLEVPCNRQTPDLTVRFEGFSSLFTPPDAGMSKPLKQWFKVWKIPPWERQHIAQIWLDEQLVALAINDRLVANVRADGSQRLKLNLLRSNGRS